MSARRITGAAGNAAGSTAASGLGALTGVLIRSLTELIRSIGVRTATE